MILYKSLRVLVIILERDLDFLFKIWQAVMQSATHRPSRWTLYENWRSGRNL